MPGSDLRSHVQPGFNSLVKEGSFDEALDLVLRECAVEIEHSKQAQRGATGLVEKCNKLRSQKKEFKIRITELDGRNGDLRAENAQFRGCITELERQNEYFRDENVQLQRRVENSQARLERRNGENAQLEARITELDSRNGGLRAENAEVQGRITELDGRNRDFWTENDQFRNRIAELDARNDDLRIENAEFRSRIMELDARYGNLQTENAQFRGRIMELEGQNAYFRGENVRIQNRVENNQAHLERRNGEIAQLHACATELEGRNGGLRTENARLEVRIPELEKRNGELQSENVQLQKRVENGQACIAEQDRRNGDLRTENVGLQSQIVQILKRAESSESALHKTIDHIRPCEGSISRTNYKGSTTPAMRWNDIDDRGLVIRIPPPSVVSPVVAKHEASISGLEKRQFQCEADMYDEVVKCLEPILEECDVANELTVSDTSRNRFLGDYAPDISICHGSVVSPLTLCAFVELKHVKTSLGAAHYGQALNYLLQMGRYQPNRRFYVGMLSCISDSAVLVLDLISNHQQSRLSPSRISRDFVPRVQLYSHLPFSAALSVLLSCIEFNAPQQHFSDGAGKILEILEASRRAMLGVFQPPSAIKTGDRGRLMVVKVALRRDDPGYENEVRILKSFASIDTVPFEVPLLVHDSPEHREFGIMPFGEPFRVRRLHKQEDMRLCLKDILSALTWIHSHGIVHRDVRPDNLILVPARTVMVRQHEYATPFSDRPHAVLIDFDKAAELDQETRFEGGYVCCPPRLLDTIAKAFDGAQLPRLDRLSMEDESPSTAFFPDPRLREEDEKYSLDGQTYRPQKSDDLLSFVLMVLTLLVPHSFETFDYVKVHKARNREFQQLRSLWKELRSSRIWGPIVEAAELEDVPELEKILEVFVML